MKYKRRLNTQHINYQAVVADNFANLQGLGIVLRLELNCNSKNCAAFQFSDLFSSKVHDQAS